MDNAPLVRASYTADAGKGLRLSEMCMASDSLILFTNVVSKITTMLCVLFLLFSLGVGIYVCVIYFGRVKPVEGWSPIMGFLSATFCGLFFVLSIIIKYLTMILQMVFLKEQYMVESVEKI